MAVLAGAVVHEQPKYKFASSDDVRVVCLFVPECVWICRLVVLDVVVVYSS